MVTTTAHFPAASDARSRALGVLLAGGILFVLGFGGPSILLSAGAGRSSSSIADRA